MKIAMIGQIQHDNKIVGYNLVDGETGQVLKVATENIVSALRENRTQIVNMKIQNNRLHIIGNIKDYALMDLNNRILNIPKYVLVQQIGNEALISSCHGELTRMNTQSLNSSNLANVEQLQKNQESTLYTRSNNKSTLFSDTPINKMAYEIARQIKSKERQSSAEGSFNIQPNVVLAYKMENNTCWIILYKNNASVRTEAFEFKNSKGYSIIDVYAVNVRKLLRAI